MPGNTVVLWNERENRQEAVPAERADAAVKAGTHSPYQQSKTYEVNGLPNTRPALGLTGAAAATPLERPVDPNVGLAERVAAERSDALSNPWLTFAEAAVDTATLGFVHERGEEADIRRAADSKAAFAGGLVGFLAPGPGIVTSAGRSVGAAAARKLLGKTSGVIAGGVKEAFAGAAVMGAIATGQQVSDAALTDHKFNGEAILSNVGMGALLGGVTGAALSPLERLAPGSRAKVAEAGGLLDPKSAESLRVASGFRGAVGTLDDAVLEYERMGAAARVLAEENPALVPTGAPQRIDAAVRRAQKSGAELRALDLDRVLAGEDMALRERFHKALEKYQADVLAVDEAFGPHGQVRPLHEPGKLHVEAGRAPFDPEAHGFRSGEARSMEEIAAAQGAGADMHAVAADALMTPERRAFYEKTYGRPWEDLPPETPVGRNAVMGEENLGGRVTPTSGDATNAARPHRPPPESAPYDSVEIGRATERGMPTTREPGPVLSESRRAVRDALDAKIAERRALGIEHDPVRSAPTGEIQIPEVGARARVQKYLDAKAAARREVLGEPRVTEIGRGIEPREPAPAAGTAEMRAVGDGAGPVPRSPEELYPSIGRPVPLKVPDRARALVEDLWRQRNASLDVRPSAVDRAAARMQSLTEEIRAGSGGGLDSAAAVDLLRNEGHRPAASALGAQIDQVIAARRIARAVADESRGVENSALRESGRKSLLSWVGNRVTANVVRRAVGGALGWGVGGPVGGILGAVFAKKVFGTAGRIAAAGAGTGEAASSALRSALSTRGPQVAVGLKAATASYDEHPRNPDPAVRAAQLRALAQNPEVIRERVRASLGDAGLLHPDAATALADKAVHQITNLSIRAPVFVVDALGRQRPQDPEQLRRWEAYERATHDLDGVLRKFGAGTLTGPEAEALEQFPEVRNRLIAGALADQEALRNLPQDRLQFLERTLHVPLTTAHDPAFVARQQMNWGPPPPPVGSNPPQSPPPTPSQAQSGNP